ncbi:MAG: PINc protein [Chloroflexi bacterium]|nr:PINc protein [Chloroflexota bacterium]
MRDPLAADAEPHKMIIAHEPDVSIVVAAMQAKVDYLVTLNRRHFLDDLGVAQRSGLRIGAPMDALARVRGQIAQGSAWSQHGLCGC